MNKDNNLNIFIDTMKEFITSRLKNTLLINFVVVWLIINYRITLTLLFKESSIDDKIKYIDNLSFDLWTWLLLPFLITIVQIFLFPYINLLFAKLYSNTVKKGIVEHKTKEIIKYNSRQTEVEALKLKRQTEIETLKLKNSKFLERELERKELEKENEQKKLSLELEEKNLKIKKEIEEIEKIKNNYNELNDSFIQKTKDFEEIESKYKKLDNLYYKYDKLKEDYEYINTENLQLEKLLIKLEQISFKYEYLHLKDSLISDSEIIDVSLEKYLNKIVANLKKESIRIDNMKREELTLEKDNIQERTSLIKKLLFDN